jgi:hypothetical protein
MKTDRELLELAARAGGELTASWYGNDAYFDGVLSRWNPLNDDGDALRLAVNLRIDVSPEYVWSGPWCDGGTLKDPYAATRRAIVRAAAAIGEGMTK